MHYLARLYHVYIFEHMHACALCMVSWQQQQQQQQQQQPHLHNYLYIPLLLRRICCVLEYAMQADIVVHKRGGAPMEKGRYSQGTTNLY